MNYHFDFDVLLHGQYRDWLLDGLWTTLQLSGVSLVFALLLAIIVAVMRMSPLKTLRAISASYVEFVRNTPLLVQMLFWYFGASQLFSDSAAQWLYAHNYEFVAAAFALVFYTAAFMAEDIRSGFRAIPREQMEAARASGLSFLQSVRFVVLPQAMRVSVPPLISQALNLIKNSSLAMAIGVAELTYQARQIESYTFKSFEAFAAATVLYLVISLIVTAAGHLYATRARGRIYA